MKKVKCIIMDWAGTAVDFGCFAPVGAFMKAFEEKGIRPTNEEGGIVAQHTRYEANHRLLTEGLSSIRD
jgi:beta-phosphoglucomutase-like phosphatase (HAD superfamily)